MLEEAYDDFHQGIFKDEESVFTYALKNNIPINTDRSYHCNLMEAKATINPHAPGAKLDSQKPMLDLVLGDFAKALQEVGKVGTMGANKYSEHGWLSVDRAETRYLSAGLRHYFCHKEGEEIDEESHLPHLAHAAWNSLAVLELYLRNRK